MVMSPTPTSWVSLHQFWDACGRKGIEVSDGGALLVKFTVDVETEVEVEEVEDVGDVEEVEKLYFFNVLIH